MSNSEAIQFLVGLALIATGAALLLGWPAALIVVGVAAYWPVVSS